MKNIIKLIGLFVLVMFSFFYTDKVATVIREEDEIMIELKEKETDYNQESHDATIVGNTMVPGISGRSVNLDSSYKKMRENGIFNEKLIVYDTIQPSVSITTNQDKFLIKGNNQFAKVSLIFIIENDKYIDKIIQTLSNKGVNGNFFISYSYLLNYSTKIKKYEGHEFYSYGEEGKYTPDNLLFSNNLINRITKNEAIYCLSSNMNQDVIKMCSENNMYTLAPLIVGGNNLYNSVRNYLENGSMILFQSNYNDIMELGIIIDYIKGKGMKITELSELLTE